MDIYHFKVNVDIVAYNTKPKGTTLINGKEIADAILITSRIRNRYPDIFTIESFATTVIAAGKTFISGCIKNPDLKSLKADNTGDYSFFGLDFDNTEGEKINIDDAISMVKEILDIEPHIYYNTFSSTEDHPKFRLLYFFKEPITTHAEFKELYLRLKILFPVIDASCSNANRLWYSTDKEVYFDAETPLIDFKELNNRLVQLVPQVQAGGFVRERTPGIRYKKAKITPGPNKYALIDFKIENVEEIAEYIRGKVDIVEFAENLGASFVDEGAVLRSVCPLHAGGSRDKREFAIFKHTKTCYCFSSRHCCAGDVINLCCIYLNCNFFQAVKYLCNSYSLKLPRKFFTPKMEVK